MNVSLHQLKVFVAVARERSFTRAAREFDLTQSAVSRCVRELEEALDLKLFDRTTRQVELTTAGTSLERRIARLLDEIELTLREERVDYEGHTGVVVLASTPVLSSNWVPGGLARCAAAFPSLVVSVRDQPHAAVLASVEQGEVDFGVVLDAHVALPDSLHAQVLFSTALCAVVPRLHPLAAAVNVRWEALSDLPLATLNAEAGGRAAVERAMAANGVRPRGVQELSHPAAVLRMVELGLGVGILPMESRWPATLAHLIVHPLSPEIKLTAMLVRRRQRSLRPNAAAAWAQFAAVGAAPVVADTGSESRNHPQAVQS
jgi:DNA-binding transcriptional LysR family regulator